MREFSLDRMVDAVHRVQSNLRLAVRLLSEGGIEHAVSGSSAVFEWINAHDSSGVRYTKYGEVVVDEADLGRARSVLSPNLSVAIRNPCTLAEKNGASVKSRPDVILERANVQIAAYDGEYFPALSESEMLGGMRVLSLRPLVRMKLARYSLNDKVDIRDLIDVGLVDQTWLASYPDHLTARLKHLIDTPDD